MRRGEVWNAVDHLVVSFEVIFVFLVDLMEETRLRAAFLMSVAVYGVSLILSEVFGQNLLNRA